MKIRKVSHQQRIPGNNPKRKIHVIILINTEKHLTKFRTAHAKRVQARSRRELFLPHKVHLQKNLQITSQLTMSD